MGKAARTVISLTPKEAAFLLSHLNGVGAEGSIREKVRNARHEASPSNPYPRPKKGKQTRRPAAVISPWEVSLIQAQSRQREQARMRILRRRLASNV